MEKFGFVRLLAIVFLWLSIVHIVGTSSPGNVTCEYEGMTSFLHDIATNYSHIANLVTIGTTVEGRELWTMIVSDSPYNRPLLRPQVKLVGNVNGMSGPACYVLLRFIQHLVEQFENEASMERKLLESVEIHVIPNFNPDGYAKAIPGSCYGGEGRLNANNVDLNANFPDIFSDNEPLHPEQAETKAMRKWMLNNSFTMSISLISGVKVVVYPFDAIINDDEGFGAIGEQNLTPDDEIFKHLSLLYAEKTGTPEMGWICPRIKRVFPHGIINGAEWDHKSGTMLDYNYIHGSFEIMVGISCCRNENSSEILEELWWENREGLLHVIQEANTGVIGQVLDAETYEAIEGASLSQRDYHYIEGEDMAWSIPFFSTKQGEFWRPWRPGNYKLRVEKAGYKTKLYDVEVQSHQPKLLQVELEKIETTPIHQEFTTPSPSPPPPPPHQRIAEQYNETIKKMTSSHHTDDFSVPNKGETLPDEKTNDHRGDEYYVTISEMETTTTNPTESEQDEPVRNTNSEEQWI